MFDDTIVDVERKAIVIALSEISKDIKIDVDMVGSQDNSNVYRIQSKDRNLNINIDFNDEDSNSFEILKTIIEYAFENMGYAITEITDDYDALENATRLFNALVMKVGEEKNWTVNNQPTESDEFVYNILTQAGDNLTKLIDNVEHKEEKMALILARHIIDDILGEVLFVDSSDLLDFLSATRLLADMIPLMF